MKKNLFLLIFLFAASMMCAFDTTEIQTDFADKATLSGKAGYFTSLNKLRIEKRPDGKTALIIRRGAWMPCVQLTHAIGENEDFGFSFNLTRFASNSAMCVSVHNVKYQKFAALTSVDSSGRLMIMDPATEKYAFTGKVLEAGRKYNIATKVSASGKTTSVYLDGKRIHVVPYKFIDKLERITFSAQLPVDNLCAIEDFDFYRRTTIVPFSKTSIFSALSIS